LRTSRRSLLKLAGMLSAAGTGSILVGCAKSVAPSEALSTADASALASPIANPIESVEVIGTGFIWTEGPVWLGDENGQLLFSDVPGNTIYSWTPRPSSFPDDGEYSWDGASTSVFLHPSGLEGALPMRDHVREGGANGLALGRGGLVICDSGNRCISLVDLETREKTVLVDRFEGKRLNSPNDVVTARNGDIYFTDPPYGLIGVRESPLRELDITGVFRITPDNQIHLIADDLFPNGIGISPDNRVLYVNSRSGRIAFDLDASGAAVGRRVFTSRESPGGGGDGFTVDTATGNLWCLSRGGIHVFTPQGQRIGHRLFDGRTSNCAFGPGGNLHITNGDRVLRCKVDPEFL